MVKRVLVFLILFIAINSYADSQNINSSGIIATSQSLASQAGLQILQQGGNAIDAAVAVGYALAVTEPCCGNIGGGGFMLIHIANGQNYFINFREKAPQAISPQLFLDNKGNELPHIMTNNYLPVGIPGTVLGLNTALKKYGTMSLVQVMQPAIQLAQKGFILSSYSADLLRKNLSNKTVQPNVAKIFFKNGRPLEAGERLIQPQLANTLTSIAKGGDSAFYYGDIPAQIAHASQFYQGVIKTSDFLNYSAELMPPIYCNYRGYQIISAPPPSSGGVTLCEMLKIVEKYPLKQWGYHSAASVHANIEAMRFAYADRNHYLGDPNFVHNPIDFLLSDNHIKSIIKQIKQNAVINSQQLGASLNSPAEKPQTTHYSILDKNGNAVAVTYTLNGDFGAKVIAGNTGFFLNNELDDFAITTTQPNQFGLIQGAANLIAPDKRPLSSMTPTIITKNGKLFLVVGSPGGSTITTTVLQIIENVIDFNMPLNWAVAAPRYHMQWLPDVVYIENNTFSQRVLLQLRHMGYAFIKGSPFHTMQWGAVNAIECDDKSGKCIGAVDPRQPDGSVAIFNNLNKPKPQVVIKKRRRKKNK